MGKKENKAEAVVDLEKLTPAELIAKVQELETTLVECETQFGEQQVTLKETEAKLEESEKMLNEALDKIDQLENRVKTGEITVEHKKVTYCVTVKKLGTLSQKAAIGAPTVVAEDLHKYPKLIEEYIKIGSSFLKIKAEA